MGKLIVFQLIFWYPFTVQATEVDNYYAHTVVLTDSLTHLNALFNYRLRQAEKWVASKGGCSDFNMREAVWRYVGGKLWAKIEIDINRLKMFNSVVPSVEDSVYKYVDFEDGGVHFRNVAYGKTISVGEYSIGSDKTGHFIAEGNAYFQKVFLNHETVDEAMKFGEDLETGVFGNQTTGVYSYGDLTANFNGMIFWAKLTPTYSNDTDFPGEPYFRCENNRWVQKRVFLFQDYIDGGWDEAINCSKFKNRDFEQSVAKRIGELEVAYKNKTGQEISLTCPFSPKACYLAKVKYHKYANRLLHPACLKAGEQWGKNQR